MAANYVQGNWVAINIAAHHDATLGATEPDALMGPKCRNPKLWAERSCPSKGAIAQL